MMPSATHSELARKLSDDDESVLDEIMKQFGPALQQAMLRRYSNVFARPDIEDLVSIGLYRLWTSRERYDESRCSLRVWLFRIVDNAARDVLRLGWHKARALEVSQSWSGFELHVPIEPHVNGSHENLDQQSPPAAIHLAVREIIADLPDAQQRILLADASVPDGTASSVLLAAELGIAESSVRVYRKRALERVRSELQRRGFKAP